MSKIRNLVNKEIEESTNILKDTLIKEGYLNVIVIAEQINFDKSSENNIHCNGYIKMYYNIDCKIKRRIEILEMLLNQEKQNLAKLN